MWSNRLDKEKTIHLDNNSTSNHNVNTNDNITITRSIIV